MPSATKTTTTRKATMSDISALPTLVAIKLLDAYSAFFKAMGGITMKDENAFATGLSR
jgi:hypothetical protein